VRQAELEMSITSSQKIQLTAKGYRSAGKTERRKGDCVHRAKADREQRNLTQIAFRRRAVAAISKDKSGRTKKTRPTGFSVGL